ncbi:hypothetical protein U9M48_033537 [Paspalum notatum var. saurae]|uniref:Transcription repressor n=1 Tax=Paspalum notatum var. saurae TaxID=547442 RepID=A0AAQ3U8H7_PASNO
MSPGAGARKRLGAGMVGVGGFALGCGCRDAKAVAVAASSSASPYSATATDTTSTATTATWRGARAALHPSSASGSTTGTLTVPSASSSSLLWEDSAEAEADGDGDTGEEVDCEREASAPTASFSGLLRQLNDLEQSVVSWGRTTPPPPPAVPERPVKQRIGGDSREGHGNFSPLPAPPSLQLQTTMTTQQHRKAKSMDKAERQAGDVHSNPKQPAPPPPSLPLPPPEQPINKATQSTDRIGKKEDDVDIFAAAQAPNPKHRKAKSSGAVRLDGSVAVVKQSEDPLSDFRRSMVNMIVENRIATGDELRELLRHFLALNAPHHHDAILRAFTEIWDEAFSSSAKATPHREPAAAARATPPRPRPKAPTPPRRRHPPPPRAWR